LVPSSGGVFDVSVDGELLFSKKAAGHHVDHEAILKLLRDRVR
jgi:selenoprotein W-related protein